MELTISILDKTHQRNNFECGRPALDHYIKKQASQDTKRDLAVCYVLCRKDEPEVIGYYTLSSHAVARSEFPEELARKLPYLEIPTVLLGRLALSSSYQGKGLGEFLLTEALNRCAKLGNEMGILAVTVDPIDEDARRFYAAFGFIALPGSGRMFMTIKTIEEELPGGDQEKP
ncbi:GNAT family N-acetyltransferase [Mucilaginibacter robiniae]|uniref:GNAT family N-acetyltransferase n=1 Tax=Mucilaginibacter robiniae TaxID=2728022 RepID=A0A7L5E2V5_9SPHI|nr:GNAT family N-acetyltransferase [Mucilaginibacter robiniae]QJD95974.1 GNAT family N-acetyltransferase [Mucilaginibacter robiniae]